MRVLISTMVLLTVALFFVQCKKGKKPSKVSSETDLENGKYIIRSKYFCNGGCFVFRSLSNYETIKWEWTTKENLESIKEDTNPYNEYVWDIVRTGALGSAIYYYPDATSPKGYTEELLNPLAFYAIYQQKPDGFYHYLPQNKLPWDFQDDEAGTGGKSVYANMVSTDISPASNAFDHDLARVFIRQITDSTRRVTIMDGDYWSTYFTLLVDPDGPDCNELDNMDSRPAWRGTWLCPHSSGTGNLWNMDACYTSQFVFEKID